MLRKIYEELKMIRVELQAIRNSVELKKDAETIGHQVQERLKELCSRPSMWPNSSDEGQME